MAKLKSKQKRIISLLLSEVSHHGNVGFLEGIAQKIIKDEKAGPNQSVNLILCSNAFIHKLNKKFRKKDKPTDVLSFTWNEPDLLGEIYISVPRVKSQAREYGHSFDTELLRLFVHGMFHLLGYDHQKKADRQRMEQKESRFCRLD